MSEREARQDPSVRDSAGGDPRSGDPRSGDPERIPTSRLAALVFPAVPLSAMGLPIAIFVPPFYAMLFQEGGMSAAAAMAVVGTVFMVVRFFDLFTDPLMGVVGDRFESRWGRRRHWCVLATPVVMLGVVAVFLVPFPGLVTPGYLVTAMVVFYIGSTMYTITLFAWGAEMTRDYDERSRITGGIQMALFVGNLTVLLPPAYIELVRGEPPGGHAALAAFGYYILIMLPIATLVAVTRVPERPTASAPQIGFWRGARIVLKNRYMRRLLLADLLIGIPAPVMTSVFIFFLRDVIGAGAWTSLILIVNMAVTVLSLPFWIWTARKLGKHRTFCLAALLACANVGLFLLLKPGQVFAFAVVVTVAGFIFGAHSMLIRAMAADTVDADNLESGGQRTGLYYSLITMTQKVGGAVGIGIAYPLLGYFGFDPTAAEQTDRAINAIRYTYTFLPALALIGAAAVMWNFPLDAIRQRKLRAELEARDRERGILTD